MACKFLKDLGMILPTDSSPKKYRYYLVVCPFCEKEFRTQARNFKKGSLLSCRQCSSGIRDRSIYHKTHGLRGSPLYEVWGGIKNRCRNISNIGYDNYGGRGISMCQEWSEDFKKFYDWAMSNGYKKGLQIDRIDNDSDYEPDNCRFTSRFINMSNTREIQKNNTTGFRGVFKYGSTGKFYSKIHLEGVAKNLGVFKTPEEASSAYQIARENKYQQINRR
jgi:hypothetical protein